MSAQTGFVRVCAMFKYHLRAVHAQATGAPHSFPPLSLIMGLLKRLFSIGSKKNKKDRLPIVHNIPVPELPWSEVSSGAPPSAVTEEEHEAAVGRLLRSSSARFVQISELDYSLLPPLPHPINNVINPPSSSAVSLASSTISQRSTYNVTVHKRRRHTPVEDPVPNLPNPKDSDKSNKRSSLAEDDSRVLRLRSDPSVASLLELYDDHGKVAADAFSNDTPARSLEPPKEGRTQVRRNGSTLRQLLGAQPSIYSHDSDGSESGEGDISWAERFLAESEATASSTSLILETPVTPKHTYTMPLKADISCTTDASMGTIDNPAISSMEVEVSMDIDDDISEGIENILGKLGNSPYMHVNPTTPQRASQIFDFLTKKQSTTPANLDRTLPELPSCFSTPSEESEKIIYNFNDPPPFTFAPARVSTLLPSVTETTPNTPKPASIRPHSTTLERTPSVPAYRDAYGGPRSAFSDDSHSSHQPLSSIQVHQDPLDKPDVQGVKVNDVKVIMTGPTKVIVTAPTPSAAHDNVPSRLRGPRALPSKSSGSIKRRRSALVELSNASSTSVSDPSGKVISGPKRQQPTNRRSSVSSVGSHTREDRPSSRTRHHRQDVVAPLIGHHKENQLGLSVKMELPSTPLRSNSHSSGSKALLRTVVHQAMFNPPSPASSSELSPVGKQMMMDVRQQRLYAREADRERAAKRSRSERAHWV